MRDKKDWDTAGDRQAARECILPDDLPHPIGPDAEYWNVPYRKKLVGKIMAALFAARRDEREKCIDDFIKDNEKQGIYLVHESDIDGG